MDNKLTGSDLARGMLRRGDKHIWCAVSDESDEEAITDLNGNDFTAYIVKSENGYFYCSGGMQWLHAVPIKIKQITSQEVRFINTEPTDDGPKPLQRTEHSLGTLSAHIYDYDKNKLL